MIACVGRWKDGSRGSSDGGSRKVIGFEEGKDREREKKKKRERERERMKERKKESDAL